MTMATMMTTTTATATITLIIAKTADTEKYRPITQFYHPLIMLQADSTHSHGEWHNDTLTLHMKPHIRSMLTKKQKEKKNAKRDRSARRCGKQKFQRFRTQAPTPSSDVLTYWQFASRLLAVCVTFHPVISGCVKVRAVGQSMSTGQGKQIITRTETDDGSSYIPWTMRVSAVIKVTWRWRCGGRLERCPHHIHTSRLRPSPQPPFPSYPSSSVSWGPPTLLWTGWRTLSTATALNNRTALSTL